MGGNLELGSALQKIRDAFQAGQLEVIVGAGASRASGLPGWNELNRRLVGVFLRQKHEDLELLDRDAEEMANVFISSIGREPAADLVRSSCKNEEEYRNLLRTALYSGGPFEPASIYRELAALVGASPHQGCFTFNFDDLMVRALRELRGEVVRITTQGMRPPVLHVAHLHGFLAPPYDPTFRDQGELVLSERDYHAALERGDWASSQLELIFNDSTRPVLLVGLSLTDPRLRRLLLNRMRKDAEKLAPVYVLLSEGMAGKDAPLGERLAYTFFRKYVPRFWSEWKGMNIIPVQSHDLVPFFLRQIRLGINGRDWTRRAHEFLAAHSRLNELHTDHLQDQICRYLEQGLNLLRHRFSLPDGEVLHIGGFLPSANGGSIRLGFHFRPAASDGNRVTSEYADSRALDVTSLEQAQGAAGFAYLWGATVEAYRDGGPNMDRNFTPAMRATWNAGRPCASLLCVPIYETRDWIPIGVAYINSSQRRPFWRDLDVSSYLELEGALRMIFSEVLQYESILQN